MRRRLDGIEGIQVLRGLLPALVGTTALSLSIFGWLSIAKDFNVWIVSSVGVVLGGTVYFAALLVMRVPELSLLITAVRNRLKKS
jgi:hypothetical protein